MQNDNSKFKILILHGWGSCAKNWSRVKESLENQGCRVYVPDLPGFGETPPPPRAWSIDDYVDWVKQVCGESPEPFFLLGHSFGGAIAVKFVNYFPEKILGLILVAPALIRKKTWYYYLVLILAKIGKLVFSLPALSLFQPLARKILYSFIGARDYYKLGLDKIITMKETFKKVISEDLINFLPNIKTPTLVIWGKRDKITPLKEAYLITKQIKDSKLEIIDEARHAPNLEMPEILAEKILNFIKAL